MKMRPKGRQVEKELRPKQRERRYERSGMARASTVNTQTRRSRRLLFNCFPSSKFHFPFAVSPVSPSPLLSFLSENRRTFKSLLFANLSFLLKNCGTVAARRQEIRQLQICRQIFQLSPLTGSRFWAEDVLLRCCGSVKGPRTPLPRIQIAAATAASPGLSHNAEKRPAMWSHS